MNLKIVSVVFWQVGRGCVQSTYYICHTVYLYTYMVHGAEALKLRGEGVAIIISTVDTAVLLSIFSCETGINLTNVDNNL